MQFLRLIFVKKLQLQLVKLEDARLFYAVFTSYFC